MQLIRRPLLILDYLMKNGAGGNSDNCKGLKTVRAFYLENMSNQRAYVPKEKPNLDVVSVHLRE